MDWHIPASILHKIIDRSLFPLWEHRWHLWTCGSCYSQVKGRWVDPAWGTPR